MSIRASVRSPPATDVVPMGCEESSFDRCLRLCPFSLAEGPRALCSARVHPGCFLWTAAGSGRPIREVAPYIVPVWRPELPEERKMPLGLRSASLKESKPSHGDPAEPTYDP
jgi:hypothetical protein